MNELGQIRTAVLTALKDAGIEALEQFPEEKIKAYTGAAATVGVGAASGKSAGFGDYLGEVTDAETQTLRQGADGADHRGAAGGTGRRLRGGL